MNLENNPHIILAKALEAEKRAVENKIEESLALFKEEQGKVLASFVLSDDKAPKGIKDLFSEQGITGVEFWRNTTKHGEWGDFIRLVGKEEINLLTNDQTINFSDFRYSPDPDHEVAFSSLFDGLADEEFLPEGYGENNPNEEGEWIAYFENLVEKTKKEFGIIEYFEYFLNRE